MCLFGISLLGVGCDSAGSGPPPPEPPPGEWEYLGLGGENISDITSIAVHPEDPDVIYVGSGFDFSAGIQGKLFKTTDGGATWDTLLVGGSYLDIEIDPQDPKTVYALPGGILKSTDGGETWANLTRNVPLRAESSLQSAAVDLRNPDVLYAGAGGPFGGCPFKSTDGGRSWKRLDPKEKDSRLCNGVTSLAIDSKASKTVYAGTSFFGEVFKSTDGGETWRRSLKNESGIVGFIAVSPHGSNRVYAGLKYEDGGLFRSDNGGDSWGRERVADSVSGTNEVAFGAEGKIYLGTIEGVFLSRPGSAWVSTSQGLPKQNRSVAALAVGPRGERLYAGLTRTHTGADDHGLYARDLTNTEDTPQ